MSENNNEKKETNKYEQNSYKEVLGAIIFMIAALILMFLLSKYMG